MAARGLYGLWDTDRNRTAEYAEKQKRRQTNADEKQKEDQYRQYAALCTFALPVRAVRPASDQLYPFQAVQRGHGHRACGKDAGHYLRHLGGFCR